MKPVEIWGGIECTVNRVGDSFYNQLARSGHADRLSDLDRIAELGIRTLRYPILWELNAPDLDVRGDWKWARERLNRLRELNVVPIVGLVHHGSGPARTCLTHTEFASGLAAYARTVASQFPWLEWYTPVNEPLTTARFTGLYGLWHPHGQDNRTFARALINQCRATVLSMRAIREINPRAKLLQTDDLGTTYNTPVMRHQAAFDNERRWLGWDLLCGRVGPDHPMRNFLIESDIGVRELDWFCEYSCPPNMIGINHYATSDRFLDQRVDRYPCRYWGANATVSYADVEAVRVIDPPPSSWAKTLNETWDRYHLPIALSEVHLGCTRDEQLRWFVGAWTAATEARKTGVDVVAITAWALFGSFDWDSLLTRDAGHYEPGVFDIRGAEPRPTALAHLIRELACGLRPTHPVLESPGWWQRDQRLLYPAVSKDGTDIVMDHSAPEIIGRPLLLWGSGKLTEMFSRSCEERGLAFHCTFHSCNDALDVTALIERIEPWAMICVDPCTLSRKGRGLECHLQSEVGSQGLASLAKQKGIPFLMLCTAIDHSSRSAEGPRVAPAQATQWRSPAPAGRFHIDTAATALELQGLANRALDLLIDQHSSSWHLTAAGLWRYVWSMSTDACVMNRALAVPSRS